MTSERFDRCFKILVGHEGGYVNNPADPGGETKFGISKRAFPTVDIKALTVEQAKGLYRAQYWHPIRGDQLPSGLGLLCFDAAVNNGVGQAIRWLQGASAVLVDGDLGPMTLAAAQKPGVDAAFHLRRTIAMTGMPGWPSFGKGWAIRLATLPFQAATLDQIEAPSHSPIG